MHFVQSTRIAASAAKVFAFHEQKDALQQLIPPWQPTRVIQPPASLAVGTEVILEMRVGPFWQKVVAEHMEYERGRMFADRMRKGPFKEWYHRHLVEPLDDGHCQLIDDITYELPGGALGRLIGGPIARAQLKRLFDYRHTVTRRACE